MNALTTYDHHFGGVVTRRSASAWVPDLVAAAGPRATDAYIEFFTATILNRNTRLGYARACYQTAGPCLAPLKELEIDSAR